jgi:hypothetical protein
MFEITYRKPGINAARRDVANLSQLVFLCQEIKCSDVYKVVGTEFKLGQAVSHDIGPDISHDISNGISHDISNGISHDISNGISHDISNGISHDTENCTNIHIQQPIDGKYTCAEHGETQISPVEQFDNG